VRGFLDQVRPTSISGWAAREHSHDQPVTVEIWDGGSRIATVAADRPREDLERHGIPEGRAGFTVPTPPELLDGQPHWVWATVEGSGTALQRSPLVIPEAEQPAVA
jgi:hypothetical protein